MARKKQQKKNPLVEGLKDAGRLVLAGIVSFLLTEGVIGALLSVYHIDLPPVISLALIASLTTFLKGLDKLLHIKGKQEGNKDMSKGLSRF